MTKTMPEMLTKQAQCLRRLPHACVTGTRIESFCRRWGILRLDVFGSILRDDFGPDSDIDLLVDLDPKRRHTLRDYLNMKEELETMFGRKVDFATRLAIEKSSSHLRRKLILSTAETIYDGRLRSPAA